MHCSSVLVWCAFALSLQRASSMDCAGEYIYDRQPPAVIVCSPYINQGVLLDCAISGPGPISLHWYFSPTLDPLLPALITNGSRYELDEMSDLNTTTRVGLAIRMLAAATENVTAGYYWCQGTVAGGTLTPSVKAKLERADHYRHVTIGCSLKTYLRSSEKACPVLLSPIDSSALSTASEPSQASTTIPMVTQSPVWPLKNSTPAQLPTSWQATTLPGTNNNSEGNLSPTKNALSSDTIPDLFGSGSLSSRSSNTWLYIILGISATSFMVIVVLGIVIFSMCRRHVRKGLQELEGLNGNNKKLSEHPLATAPHEGKNGFLSLPPPPPHGLIPYYQQTMDIHLPCVPSEDYAEVGPALRDQRLQISHDYSEIREFLPEVGLHLSTTGHSGGQQQVLLSSTQLQQNLLSSTLQSRDCHTTSEDVAALFLVSNMQDLSTQVGDVVLTNENEGDVTDSHTYHILQLSGYSSSDNTSEVDTAVKDDPIENKVSVVTTVPGAEPTDPAVASGLKTPVETLVPDGVVASVEAANDSTSCVSLEEGYSRLTKNPACRAVPSDGFPQESAAQDDTAYSRLVRATEVMALKATEVVPFGTSQSQSNLSGVQNDIAVGMKSVCSADNVVIIPAPDLVAGLSCSSNASKLLHPLHQCTALVPLSSPSDLLAVESEGVTLAQQGVTVVQERVDVAPQGVVAALQHTVETSASLLSKYRGDYERDSAYMEAMQWTSSSRPRDTNQAFLDNAHHDTSTMPHAEDNTTCQSMESLCPEAHLYQALMSMTREKSKPYMDLQLKDDWLKTCTDARVMDGDQSNCRHLNEEQFSNSQLGGDQSKQQCVSPQLIGDQLKRYTDLQLDGDQSRQYSDLHLDRDQ